MGITGLLQFLKGITEEKNLSQYKNLRIAVDGYCWLHKSVYTMHSEILENPNSLK